MNILITSVSNKVNLVKYFRRALFNEGAGKIFGSDTDPLVQTRLFLDQFLRSPLSSSADYASWLLDHVARHEIKLIIPSRDEDLACLTPLKQTLLHRYHCRTLLPDPDVMDICLDKSRFYQWCAAQGYGFPHLYHKEEVCEQDLPLFVKPKTGSGSRNTFRVDTWSQWLELKADLDERYLIQQYMDAQEYTIDLFVSIQGEVLSIVPRARLKTLNGESVHSRVVLDTEIINACTDLALKLGLEAHNTIQCFKQGKHIVFSEVNARFGGGFTLGIEAGADTPRYLVRESKSLAALPSVLSLQDGLEMIRIQKDIFYCASQSKVFCFDLDGTICSEACAYEAAQPMPLIVDKINSLYRQGHRIIIATARGAASKTCWRELTEQQLKAWGIKYHELVTTKPFADHYIDNKAMDVLEFVHK